MKLLNLFKFQGTIVGISSFSIVFNYYIKNSFSFEIDLQYEDDGYEWLFKITDLRSEWANTPVKQSFPTALKFNISADKIYSISKKNSWKLPVNYFKNNPHLFPTQEQMESELMSLKPMQFFIKNIWEKL